MKKFTRLQISYDIISSGLLFAGLILALIISNNSLLLSYYRAFINVPFSFGIGDYFFSKSILKWVNDGLMALFFFLLGLEMKYQIMEGDFQEKSKLLLPTVAALGGFVVPVLIYSIINYNFPEGRVGWAIPVATDTAFVLAIISFFGKKIDSKTKTFLIGLSIIDDVLAILTLAVFYTPYLDIVQIYLCAIPIFFLFLLNYYKISHKWLYYTCGIVLWLFTVKSGVHGTIAGIILAFFIPNRVTVSKKKQSILKEVEVSLHNLVSFFILPLFAFVNCELPLNELSLGDVYSPIFLGCFFGLFIGKPLGIYSFIFLGAKFKMFTLEENLNSTAYFGLSCLCGIGFTLSLFIGLQALDSNELENQMKLGVLLASFASAFVGGYICNKM